MSSTSFFSADGNVAQSFTVPTTGIYDITAYGAAGGGSENFSAYSGGAGAEMKGRFSLTAGETLTIDVGLQGAGAGQAYLHGYYGGGGGGGSFVMANGAALLIAGGGGGASYNTPGYAGSAGTGGGAGGGRAGAAGGSGGNGGTYRAGAAGSGGGLRSGGGGFFTTGGGGYPGLAGGRGDGQGGNGGFGGGGGGFAGGGGGGGGYSGGGGGTDFPLTQGVSGATGYGGGGGGGSIDNGTPLLAIGGENSGDGSVVITFEAICFLRGTRILTPTGYVAVERLQVGDPVITLRAQPRRVRWIGVGTVSATPGKRSAATPVIVRRGAIAANVPDRDLHITKGHSLYFDGALIPVELLVNHRSIVWNDRARDVAIYHVELESHDILVANGVAAESYRDDGNRWLFGNASSGWSLPPQPPCVPVATSGPLVEATWRRLLCRAGGPMPRTMTEDADLHLLVDGRRVDAVSRQEGSHVFPLPPRPRSVRIVSRSGIPSQLGLTPDQRRLGVAIGRVVLRRRGRFETIEAGDARLTEGFHGYEPAGGLRWTDGDALLPAPLLWGLDEASELVLHLAARAQYPLTPGVDRRAAA